MGPLFGPAPEIIDSCLQDLQHLFYGAVPNAVPAASAAARPAPIGFLHYVSYELTSDMKHGWLTQLRR